MTVITAVLVIVSAYIGVCSGKLDEATSTGLRNMFLSYQLVEGVEIYLKCLDEKMGFRGKYNPADLFRDISYVNHKGEREACEFRFEYQKYFGDLKRKGFNDGCKPISIKQEMANRNLGKIFQRFEESITTGVSSKNISSSEVKISAEASTSISTVKEVGAKVEASDTSGKETTRESEKSVTQKWERKYVVPSYMKGTAQLLECERLVNLPEIQVRKIQGCLPITFEIRGDFLDIQGEEWKECGEPPIGTIGDKRYVFRLSNFKDEWKNDGKGGLIRKFTKTNLFKLPFIKFERKAKIISDEAAHQSYCETLSPVDTPNGIEQEVLQEQDEVDEITEKTKDLADFTWDWDWILEEAEEDEKDEEEKKKEKCKIKKSKRCNKYKDKKGKNKSKKPGRRARKARQARRRRRG